MSTAHSDKGLATIAAMNTQPSDWKLTSFRWVKETRKLSVEGECPQCKGRRFVVRDEQGALLPEPPTTYGYTAEDRIARDKVRAWNVLYQAQNPQTDAWSAGNCSNCKNSRKYPGRSTGKAMVLRDVQVEVGYPIWPEGVRFDSRFGGGCTCGLCGKTILKSNLVPVHAIGADGKAHGMWIGADCAKKVFSIKHPASRTGFMLEVA